VSQESGELQAWANLDTAFFDVAKKQIEWHQRDFVEAEKPNEYRIKLWGVACAAASMAMVCAAMEAHANLLLDRSARGQFPNHIGLSVSGAESLCSTLSLQGKWLFAAVTLTGKQVLDPGKAPFQGFCQAITRRNKFIAHAKLTITSFPLDVEYIHDRDIQELGELTIANAQAAIDAAQKTVQLVYANMGGEPPLWAKG
jgi:hypothetical protein